MVLAPRSPTGHRHPTLSSKCSARRTKVTTAAMEATSVYWIPLITILRGRLAQAISFN